MITVYLQGLIVCALIMFLFVVLAAVAHLDFNDAESAGYLKFFLGLFASTLVWPLYGPAIVIGIIYTLVKAIGSLIRGDYR